MQIVTTLAKSQLRAVWSRIFHICAHPKKHTRRTLVSNHCRTKIHFPVCRKWLPSIIISSQYTSFSPKVIKFLWNSFSIWNTFWNYSLDILRFRSMECVHNSSLKNCLALWKTFLEFNPREKFKTLHWTFRFRGKTYQ